jgi:hypothetical protein
MRCWNWSNAGSTARASAFAGVPKGRTNDGNCPLVGGFFPPREVGRP